MAQSNQTTLAILLIVGLVVGAGAGYMLAPKGGEGEIVYVDVPVDVEVHPLAGKTIQIGLTAAQTEDLETFIPAYDVMAERDINEFNDAIGLDITIDLISSPAGDHCVARTQYPWGQ